MYVNDNRMVKFFRVKKRTGRRRRDLGVSLTVLGCVSGRREDMGIEEG